MPSAAEFRDALWLWTLSPGFIRRVARRRSVLASVYAPWDALHRFYPTRNLMFFTDSVEEVNLLRGASGVERIVCSIQTPGIGDDLAAAERNAEALGRLSRNGLPISGGIIDDFSSMCVKKAGAGPDDLRRIYQALKRGNPDLSLYVVIYTMNFDVDWRPFLPFLDRVSLWVWKAADLANRDLCMGRCHEVFPGKPINLGMYIYDYGTTAEMLPLDCIRGQLCQAERYHTEGCIEGVSILGSYLHDEMKTPQAQWVSAFLGRAAKDR